MINYKPEKVAKILKENLMGKSIRSLALDMGKSVGSVYKQLRKEIQDLPHNNQVTVDYCDKKRFHGVLVVDGKYVKVKGYDKKIPFIYGIDYLTHDIPICLLAPSENYIALKLFFTKLKNTGYRLYAVVCDDNKSIQQAAKDVFPDAFVQVCHVHFLENIRKSLCSRSDEMYQPFVKRLEEHIFHKPKMGKKMLKRRLHELLLEVKDDEIKVGVLHHIYEYRKLLTGYMEVEKWRKREAPKSTNLIECYNKHLNGRLKTIQGFESFHSAEKWLSAYTLLFRRMKKFTSCSKKFRQLNGLYSLQKTRNKRKKLPNFF